MRTISKSLFLIIFFSALLVFPVVRVYAEETETEQTEMMEKDESNSDDQKMMEEEQMTEDQAMNEPVNSFDLFWPIAPGKTMGEPLYFLKSIKEKVREALIFSTFRKADYNKTLSEKRLLEAEKLLTEKSDLKNGKKSLAASQAKREKALAMIKKSEGEGKYVVDLKNGLASSLEKQRALLIYLSSKLDGEAKSAVEENLSGLATVYEQVKQ